MAFETIRRGRERLIALLLPTPDPVLDEVASLGIVTEEEDEALEKLSEPRERIRRLLIKIQRKGERGCEQFLECLQSLFPDFPPDLQPPGRRCVTQTNDAENPEGGAFSEKIGAENPQVPVTSEMNELENPGGKGPVTPNSATSPLKNGPENPGTAFPAKNDPESPGGDRSSEKDAASVSSERADFKSTGWVSRLALQGNA
ncbi:mitochondrial import receptor subunit TOM40-like protein [Platysternon megacephalum]|uniref:Mitochondrial import receptor subunit TOM40-like protein n=1 Tax=Platysternon megacephalum TaxID=55544 RepID=A0A4D9DG73_9SAUR|nr:mitochondrial import receptor subunit TOM40-like protein [Platysternon megacephalum]